MSRRWLLSLLCLSVPFLLFVQFTGARGVLRVNEANIRVIFQREPAEVHLAIENLSGEILNSRVQVELLDPRNRIAARVERVAAIARGNQILVLSLPLYVSRLAETDRSQLLWCRLHYRITPEQSSQTIVAEGIVSLSTITPDLFELRVATSDLAREGGRYRARVQAVHPITRRPAANVSVDAEVTLEDNDDRSVKLRASGLTDATGYTVLEFQIPARFPQFPHTLQPAGGEIHVKGRRGALVAEAENQVLVDQFAQILISTDKPLYQPGQVLHARALVLRPSQHALAGQTIVFKISDPEGTNVFRTSLKSTRFGIASADWPIPENTRLGDYRIKVSFDGQEEGETVSDVRVSRYDLPNFSVKVEPDRKYYLHGQKAEVKVRADYLFGQPVARGHVRVVRETEGEWNYREQKWDIEEGEKYEGDTDANGVFNAHINLTAQYDEIGNEDYERFRDVSYATYFTDPTTKRTEQRRFDLRVSKEAIHVYVIAVDGYYSRTLPLRFYVSTFYADGSPARCTAEIGLKTAATNSGQPKRKPVGSLLTTVRTNRYGLAKVVGLRLPRELDDKSDLGLTVSARDSSGQTGSETQDLSIDDEPTLHVDTAKTLYRTGEPITAFITASAPAQTVVVDLVQDSTVIRSDRLQLHEGRGSITFPYRPELKDKVTIAAYEDFAESQRMISNRTVLYPRNHDLKVDVRSTQASYRPGADARVSLRVHAPGGESAESVLGVVVFDKAVEERSRTDTDFGSRSYGFYGSLRYWLGANEQLAGVTLKELEHLDMSRVVSPELDLLAEVLLNQNRNYYANFFHSESFESDETKVFGATMKLQLEPLKEALMSRYVRTREYPRDETSLRRLLALSGIEQDGLRDPWGTRYRAVFAVDKQADDLNLMSAGPDKQFATGDDFLAESMGWPYFRPVGEALDRAVKKYHERTGGFIRDFDALRGEVAKEGVDLDALRDRWNQPYRFDFEVKQRQYEIKISSAGPDKEFASEKSYLADDFVSWTLSIDYFAEPRAKIDAVLSQQVRVTNHFPRNDAELAEALQNSEASLAKLSDPWGRPYYATFRIQSMYSDSVSSDRAPAGESTTQQTRITPVTRTLTVINLRSLGADGKAGTVDDFDVASFTGALSEQTGGETQPRVLKSSIVLSGANGAITGVVTDAPGAVVLGATVTATLNSQSYTATTDDEGKYLLANLPPGEYELRVAAAGFKFAVITNVVVETSSITTVNLSLELGAPTETVTVSSSAPRVQTKAMDAAELTSVRFNGRAVSKFINVITKSGGTQQTSTPRLREYFPETLVWQPSIETDKQGRAQINFKLADNITTWKLAVIGSTEDGQIGAVEKEIKAFQPFFVEHDPPRILTEGDEISLPVVVRNYLERAQPVELEIKPESWFTLLGPGQKRAQVAAGDATRETFDFRASASVKDGKQRLTATGADDSDAIEKPVTVHPDGEEKSATASDIVSDSATLTLDIPATLIPNSAEAELKIYPNLMAHVSESVEAIMQRPYGCGEQTISSTYPSLLLVQNHKQTGQSSVLQARAERYLRDGYSRLLNYRADSGGFTYWGRGEPDLALTAYALRFLSDARDLIAVDDDVIAQARRWLVKQQRADGSWAAYDYGDKLENKRRTAVLTAYVARVLSKSAPAQAAGNTGAKQQPSNAVSPVLKRALDYLATRVAEIDEPYLIASYVLAAHDAEDSTRAAAAMAKLSALAHNEGDSTYWELETNTPFYGWGLAGRIETTALVVQALTRGCGSQGPDSRSKSDTAVTTPQSAICNQQLIDRGLLFLLHQKDRYGVWYSSQATINVLDALLAVLAHQVKTVGATNAQPTAEIIVNGRSAKSVEMPAAGQLVSPITIDLTGFLQAGTNRIQIRRASGASPASVQAVATYYIPWSASNANPESSARPGGSSGLRLVTRFDQTEGQVSDVISCHVEAERIGFHGYGMLLAEIGLPPGADVDRASLENAMKSSDWAISQYDILPDRVVVYLWPQAGGVKFDFKFRPRFGLKAKTAPSSIYDYYNPEARAVVVPTKFVVK